jgi:basic amino acid/polyamine antiporter, APA family
VSPGSRKSSNWSPFATGGFNGMVDAAALIFFAYIGFDAVSTSGEETKKPSRDLPIGIIGSLVLSTGVYILVAIVATGLLPADELANSEDPLSAALADGGGFGWAGDIISLGACVAIASVVLTILYGQTRIMFAICRDGLLPRGFAKLNPKTQTPVRITVAFAIAISVIAAFLPLSEIAKLVNIGTLFAFVLVNIGVIVLRRTKPDLERGFRVPFVPVFPIVGALLCIFLMKYLDGSTWIRFGIWLLIGLVIYFAYGMRHSRLRRGEAVGDPEKGLEKG